MISATLSSSSSTPACMLYARTRLVVLLSCIIRRVSYTTWIRSVSCQRAPTYHWRICCTPRPTVYPIRRNVWWVRCLVLYGACHTRRGLDPVDTLIYLTYHRRISW